MQKKMIGLSMTPNNKFQITQTEVFGLQRSMTAAGLPKSDGIYLCIPKGIKKLGSAVAGSGHDCFLKGIVVAARITADHSFWLQWQRYHFQEIVSSTSKMHTITTLSPAFHEYVDTKVIDCFNEYKELYLKNPTNIGFEKIIMNTPMGMMLTAEIRTNYLQLKTTYTQRKTHKMSAWREYCKWIEELPSFMELAR